MLNTPGYIAGHLWSLDNSNNNVLMWE